MEALMKPLYLIRLSVFSILVAGLFPFLDAAADDKTCVLKADVAKVYVVVWDEDSEEERQDKILKIGLNQENAIKLKAPPVLLFSAINLPKTIGLMATTIETVKTATPSGCPDILDFPLWGHFESGRLPCKPQHPFNVLAGFRIGDPAAVLDDGSRTGIVGCQCLSDIPAESIQHPA